MDKWLKLSKGHDADDHATKSSQARLNKQASNGRKRNMMSLFNLGLHLKIVMVMKNLFV